MKKYIPALMVGSLIAAIMLAGCSSGSDTAAPQGTNQTAGSDNAAARQGGPGEQGQNGMNRQAMNFGKIKSVSGSTITVYTAEMPQRPQNGAGGQAPEGGQPAEGQGTPPEGGQPADGQGTPPEGGQPADGQAAGAEGGRGQGGGMRGGMMQSFSEETTDITVPDGTKVLSVTFENGERKETEISLSDLKADDIIQYTLKEGTAEAESITLSTGGFGGGQGFGGGAPGAGQDGGGDAAASSGSN
ncbi:hypothetical protein ['Paenibacillus yunnanensis' Narsing Rao et al. 2020]|uniref:hypothetical protein n=1 Tax=Paenibacillus tengchongensis TaxID=2608684 RepID=UPI0016523796|nr:hypothetical protein [Paenibacillus tengchongensis]